MDYVLIADNLPDVTRNEVFLAEAERREREAEEQYRMRSFDALQKLAVVAAVVWLGRSRHLLTANHYLTPRARMNAIGGCLTALPPAMKNEVLHAAEGVVFAEREDMGQ